MNRNQLEKIISDAWEARNNINTETTGEIRNAVEDIFGVRVLKVNTLNRKGKRKRNRRNFTYGRRSDQKRALVTLAEGDSIELFDV